MKNLNSISIKTVSYALLLAMISLIVSCSHAQQGENAQSATEASLEMDIHTAALTGNVEMVKAHIKAGTDLNMKEPAGGSTPLITAAVFGKTEVAKALVAAGADLNIQNNDGSSALHSAAFFGHTEIVDLLISSGIDKSLKNNFGSTALESVTGPYVNVKPIYDYFMTQLGPLGLEISHEQLEATRPKIAEMLK